MRPHAEIVGAAVRTHIHVVGGAGFETFNVVGGRGGLTCGTVVHWESASAVVHIPQLEGVASCPRHSGRGVGDIGHCNTAHGIAYIGNKIDSVGPYAERRIAAQAHHRNKIPHSRLQAGNGKIFVAGINNGVEIIRWREATHSPRQVVGIRLPHNAGVVVGYRSQSEIHGHHTNIVGNLEPAHLPAGDAVDVTELAHHPSVGGVGMQRVDTVGVHVVCCSDGILPHHLLRTHYLAGYLESARAVPSRFNSLVIYHCGGEVQWYRAGCVAAAGGGVNQTCCRCSGGCIQGVVAVKDQEMAIAVVLSGNPAERHYLAGTSVDVLRSRTIADAVIIRGILVVFHFHRGSVPSRCVGQHNQCVQAALVATRQFKLARDVRPFAGVGADGAHIHGIGSVGVEAGKQVRIGVHRYLCAGSGGVAHGVVFDNPACGRSALGPSHAGGVSSDVGNSYIRRTQTFIHRTHQKTVDKHSVLVVKSADNLAESYLVAVAAVTVKSNRMFLINIDGGVVHGVDGHKGGNVGRVGYNTHNHIVGNILDTHKEISLHGVETCGDNRRCQSAGSTEHQSAGTVEGYGICVQLRTVLRFLSFAACQSPASRYGTFVFRIRRAVIAFEILHVR